jgi:hypothetical protein
LLTSRCIPRNEFLYPPLTYLLLDTSKRFKRMEDGTIEVYVTPQWS